VHAHPALLRVGDLRAALPVFALLALGAAPAPDLSGAHAFLARIYAHYPVPATDNAFTPFGKEERRVFDASLAGLIDEDERLAGGEVGALDGDPLCDCQDDSGLTFAVGAARPDGPGGAVIDVVRRETYSKPAKIEHIGVVLRLQNGAWRIHDIRSPDTPSLRAYLEGENRKRRRH
jgi:hypothetical protein